MSKKSILNDCPNALLGWPISETHQVYLSFLVPAVLNCCVYIVHFAADLVLAYEHFKEENLQWALITFVLICLPAVIAFIFTVSSPELWPNKGFQNFIGWVCIKLFEHVFFPVWAMYGYAERIFWSIEAVRSKNIDRENCLWNAMKTRPIELYFFLQAYLQAAPQLLLQINILLHKEALFKNDTVNMQMLSIIMSLILLALTTMSYQNYESQKLLGRRYPWSRKQGTFIIKEKHSQSSVVDDQDEQSNFISPVTYLPTAEEDTNRRTITAEVYSPPSTSKQSQTTSESEEYSDLPESDKHLNDYRQSHRSVSFELRRDPDESIYERLPSLIYDTPDHQTDSTIRERINQTSGDSNEPKVVSYVSSASEPPNYPAPPRPDGLHAAFDDLVEKVRTNIFRTPDTIDLPIRRYSQIGREQDDAVGKVILFLTWFCFILSRILCISVFGRFFVKPALYFLLIHFSITTFTLIYSSPRKYINRIILYIFLGYVYIFCIIEFRIKFKRFYRTYIIYFIIMFTENFILTVVWCLEDWDSWWFFYILFLIIFNSLMSVAFTILYIKLLKPTKTIIYDLIF